MSSGSYRPNLSTERKETPPFQDGASGANLSPYHRALPYCSAAEPAAHSQIAAFLVRQARRNIRRAGNRRSSTQWAEA